MKEIIEGIKSKTKQQLKNPGAVFGILYPYILVVGIIIGIYYVRNLDNIAREHVPPVISDSTIVTDLPEKKSVVVPPINIFDYKTPSQELLSEGEKLFKANCASCHGENGTGGGPAAVGLNPAPRNFTSKDNWINGTKLSQIYTTLQEGIPNSAMVSYDYLLPKEKIALAQYIRTNFIPNPDQDTDSDLRNLDATYNLSAGQEVPAQIPVAKAMGLIINENEKNLDKVNTALESLISNLTTDDARLFTKVVDYPKIAFSFLLKNISWKNNVTSFTNLIINNVNQNGFNGEVFNLKSNEWSQLYNFMLKMI